MKAYGGMDVYIHIFLTSALVGGEWSASRSRHFTPGERAPGTYWIGGWVEPRAGLDDVDKRRFLTLLGLELRTLCRTRSPSLYRRAIPATYTKLVTTVIYSAISALYSSLLQTSVFSSPSFSTGASRASLSSQLPEILVL
jgi:hypothetical protein